MKRHPHPFCAKAAAGLLAIVLPLGSVCGQDSLEVTFVGDGDSVLSLPAAAAVGRQLAETADGTSSTRAAFSLNSTLKLHLEGLNITGDAASHGVAAVLVHRGLLVMRQCVVRGVQGHACAACHRYRSHSGGRRQPTLA